MFRWYFARQRKSSPAVIRTKAPRKNRAVAWNFCFAFQVDSLRTSVFSTAEGLASRCHTTASRSEQAFAIHHCVMRFLLVWGPLRRPRITVSKTRHKGFDQQALDRTRARKITKRQPADYVHRDSPMRRLCQESSTHKRRVTDVYRTKSDNCSGMPSEKECEASELKSGLSGGRPSGRPYGPIKSIWRWPLSECTRT